MNNRYGTGTKSLSEGEEEEEEEAWVLPLGRAAALLEVRRGAHHAAP